METNRPAADRVRHILEAMERSIDDARRKRMTGADPTPSADRTYPHPAMTSSANADNVARHTDDEQLIGGNQSPPSDAPVRLKAKAKPKRPNNVIMNNDDGLQSRAG